MNEKINAVNDKTKGLDQTDEEILTSEVSDEALEAAATGADSWDRKNSTPQCCSFGRC